MRKKFLLPLFLIFSLMFNAFAAWDPDFPTDDGFLEIAPAQFRAQWLAIALGTDPALLITNAKVSPTANISDTKLGTIATANKVNASAFFNLSGTPAGAGVMPTANVPTLNTLIGSSERGDILYFNGTNWVKLPHGTNGQYLQSQGHDANPRWATVTTIPSGIISLWYGTIASIPSGWALCDGTNGTPDLRDKFIVGAKQDDSGVAKTNVTGSLTQSGGSVNISEANLPPHLHDKGTLTIENESGHIHLNGTAQGSGGGGGGGPPYAGSTGSSSTGSGSAHKHDLTGSTGSTGSGTAYTQPYYALAYIMKL